MTSLRLKMASAVVKGWRGPTLSADGLRREYVGRAAPQPAPLPKALLRVANVEETRVDGRSVFRVTPRSRASDWHILYTHGGAFVNPLHASHWEIVAALVSATGASVTVPLYPLAPEHPHADAFAFLERVYRGMLEHTSPERIVFCGDSAGGNLVLTQALRYRALGLPLPAHLVPFAPWVDLSLSDPRAREVERDDILLRVSECIELGRWWCGATDARDPSLSPLFADGAALASLPPMQVFQGTHDILWPDAVTLCAKVKAAGGRCELHEEPGAFHVYMGATFAPEAKRVFAKLGKLLRR